MVKHLFKAVPKTFVYFPMCATYLRVFCVRRTCTVSSSILVSTFFFFQMANSQPEKTFIRNKAAQVFALLFVTEYLTKWPKFFFDVLSVVGLNPQGVDLYLRILMAVDAELVDRDVVHTSEASCLFRVQEYIV